MRLLPCLAKQTTDKKINSKKQDQEGRTVAGLTFLKKNVCHVTTFEVMNREKKKRVRNLERIYWEIFFRGGGSTETFFSKLFGTILKIR